MRWRPIFTASAQQGTASINGNAQSLYFAPFSHYDASSRLLTTFLTTYDGVTTTFPLNQPVFGQFPKFSGELRPRATEPGNYEADYASYTTALNPPWKEYGSFTVFSLPTTDSDNNGLPDIAQSNKVGNATATGILNIDWPFPTVDGLTITMSRPANQISGAYTIKLSSEPNAAVGNFQLLNIGGSVTYARSSGAIALTFAITDPLGATRTVSGSTTYSVPNFNQVVLPQFSVSGGGASYTFQSGLVLNRTGSRYVGSATLGDGLPETGWADATKWVVEINDPNDWDANGIPDLSDAI